jgi:hypothetical protein
MDQKPIVWEQTELNLVSVMEAAARAPNYYKYLVTALLFIRPLLV